MRPKPFSLGNGSGNRPYKRSHPRFNEAQAFQPGKLAKKAKDTAGDVVLQ